MIVGHIPKVEIVGKRQYSRDLPQGGMELPALYVFKTTNLEMHYPVTQSCQKGHENIQRCKDKSNGQAKNKRQNKKMICIFEHYSYKKKKI